MVVERRIDAVVLASGNMDDRHVELFAFDLHQPELASDVTASGLSVSLATDQQMHLEVASEALQPRREIDGIADHRIIETLFPPQIANYAVAGSDADADVQAGKPRIVLLQLTQILEHLECAIDRGA